MFVTKAAVVGAGTMGGQIAQTIAAAGIDVVLKDVAQGMIDAGTPGHAILASNTSGLSITELGDATVRPDKVVGFHYFYPASVMPLVEVIEGDDTAQETMQAAVAFAQVIKKQPIT